ncbi:uncharacterized protein LOC116347460 [Contarinia nasturtii]|uniref:uncharacterized protein LOC116347460 n=1 Tax=Contarinia nasturtii TaxID=265458 RepID=UPI0012D4AFA8|nr:uncharacterized protein LOC116347460 [Contarinia nasturtii]
MTDKQGIMSQKQDADQSGAIAQKMKSNDEDNNPAKRAVVAVNDEQKLAEIFKLTIDCFEEVFDYLSLKDLASIGQTCKRMKRIAGHCFLLNYEPTTAYFHNGGFNYNRVKIDCFSNLIQNVFFNYEDATNDQTINFITLLKQFTSIKGLEIADVHLTMAWINEMEAILCEAESLTLVFSDCEENVFDAFVAACPKVKYLSLAQETNETHWLHKIFPALEHIQLCGFDWDETPALKTFFELNTTIKQFSVDVVLLWSNRELFKNSNIKLDILAINYDFDDDKIEFDLFCRLLNELYEHGFYKKLHFYSAYGVNQEVIDQLASVKGLVEFRSGSSDDCINVGALSSLEELRVYESRFVTDLKTLPHMLLKLKRICFYFASSDDILPFICHATNLNKIKVECIQSGSHFDENDKILDLIALNKERKKLVGALKITIYVGEDVYLATKWATKQTDFNMIEMKRESSYAWDV